MLRANQLDIDRAFVLVIDLQEKLVPLVHHHERVVAAGATLLDCVAVFELPVLATEQYPKGLGRTVQALSGRLEKSNATVIEKATFSAWAHPHVRETILTLDRPQVVMIGIEAHICIQQTTLDLISRDYDVFVCADAVGSCSRIDYKQALERMRQEGAFVTTVESVLFELCNRCDTAQFKAMLNIIRTSKSQNVEKSK